MAGCAQRTRPCETGTKTAPPSRQTLTRKCPAVRGVDLKRRIDNQVCHCPARSAPPSCQTHALAVDHTARDRRHLPHVPVGFAVVVGSKRLPPVKVTEQQHVFNWIACGPMIYCARTGPNTSSANCGSGVPIMPTLPPLESANRIGIVACVRATASNEQIAAVRHVQIALDLPIVLSVNPPVPVLTSTFQAGVVPIACRVQAMCGSQT